MILVDTSIWVDHLRRRDAALVQLLDDGEVATHVFVVGELACGHLANRAEILSLLQALPHLPAVEHEEALEFVARHAIAGAGIGWIDAHLLAATALARVHLWTRDRRLLMVARRLRLAA